MALLTRRELTAVLAGAAAARALPADEPKSLVSGLDHLKLRVANSGAAAIFYYDLFGGEIVSLRNTTLPGNPLVDEFFLKFGAPTFPYLMLSQVRNGELPGLDHLSVLAVNQAALRAMLESSGASPSVYPNVRDTDGSLIELMMRPTWGHTLPSIRLTLPANLRSLRPAFEPVALQRLRLRTMDVNRSSRFYGLLLGAPAASTTFPCGSIALELRPLAADLPPGLDRLIIAVRNLRPKAARRVLQERGIQPYGQGRDVLFRDLDGNELQLIAA